MVNIYESQVYFLKVHNINCCENCPKKLEEALKTKLHGIESVEVDTRQNIVRVEGSIDSKIVIDKIKNWGKKAELVPERDETNPLGHTVESNDEDEGQKEDLLNASRRREDSSSRQKDSSAHQEDSSARHKSFFSRIRWKIKGSNNASSQKEIPDYACRNKCCTVHKRDNYKKSDPEPNTNHGPSYLSLYHGTGNFNHPMMNSFVQAPPPLSHLGQYYGPGMVPPMTGYGGDATQRQMPRPMANGFWLQPPLAGFKAELLWFTTICAIAKMWDLVNNICVEISRYGYVQGSISLCTMFAGAFRSRKQSYPAIVYLSTSELGGKEILLSIQSSLSNMGS
ncbi:hypothetical protein POM88_035064 [Heracleum sosnowskyi]|uniref:HMA domain-containing protein n=1 Tax=Heracleum sosnowskyi TaxID=360622 RepID=A0AAD8MDL8_9APIA|nr:hypothetical protein POM88_035064 [Heracleum sosnowskyi]